MPWVLPEIKETLRKEFAIRKKSLKTFVISTKNHVVNQSTQMRNNKPKYFKGLLEREGETFKAWNVASASCYLPILLRHLAWKWSKVALPSPAQCASWPKWQWQLKTTLGWTSRSQPDTKKAITTTATKTTCNKQRSDNEPVKSWAREGDRDTWLPKSKANPK